MALRAALADPASRRDRACLSAGTIKSTTTGSGARSTAARGAASAGGTPTPLAHRGSALLFPLIAAAELAQPYLLKIAIDEHILKADWLGLTWVGGLYAGVWRSSTCSLAPRPI